MVLQDDLLRSLRTWIAGGRGAEVCGYIMTDAEGRQRLYGVKNRYAESDAVFVASVDAARAQRYARKYGLAIVAWFHSHSGDCRLSDLDKAWLAAGEVPWVVASLRDSTLTYQVTLPQWPHESESGTF